MIDWISTHASLPPYERPSMISDGARVWVGMLLRTDKTGHVWRWGDDRENEYRDIKWWAKIPDAPSSALNTRDGQ